MRAKTIAIFLAGIMPLLFQGCRTQVDSLPVKIALSDGFPEASYANYYNWIRAIDSTVISMDMYNMPLDSAIKKFRECSGLVLTGGTDINPALYQNPGDTARCWTIDDYRDQLEMTLVDSALVWGIPVLGICRGHQMLNVALGGSLIIDIPSDFDTTVSHKCQDPSTCFHSVKVEGGSLLNDISGLLTGTVNSNHHQGIKVLSPQLKIVAYSSDSLPEAVEWADSAGKPFLMGVQWHPERLDLSNPLSGPIATRFLDECKKYRR